MVAALARVSIEMMKMALLTESDPKQIAYLTDSIAEAEEDIGSMAVDDAMTLGGGTY